jgi:hypothetical protein
LDFGLGISDCGLGWLLSRGSSEVV